MEDPNTPKVRLHARPKDPKLLLRPAQRLPAAFAYGPTMACCSWRRELRLRSAEAFVEAAIRSIQQDALHGYCAVTTSPGDCRHGASGSWLASKVGLSRDIDVGLAAFFSNSMCLRCSKCNFVSYSRKADDCSWFDQCQLPLKETVDGAPQFDGTFQTVRVRNGTARLASPRGAPGQTSQSTHEKRGRRPRASELTGREEQRADTRDWKQ